MFPDCKSPFRHLRAILIDITPLPTVLQNLVASYSWMNSFEALWEGVEVAFSDDFLLSALEVCVITGLFKLFQIYLDTARGCKSFQQNHVDSLIDFAIEYDRLEMVQFTSSKFTNFVPNYKVICDTARVKQFGLDSLPYANSVHDFVIMVATAFKDSTVKNLVLVRATKRKKKTVGFQKKLTSFFHKSNERKNKSKISR